MPSKRYRKAAEGLDTGFHIHVAEHSVDEYDSLAKTGTRIVDRLQKHGILGPKTIVVHAVHVDAREIELVSSDQALGREAAGRGARVVRSQEFLAAVGRALEHGPPPEKPEAPTPDEVAEWLEKFSGG